MTTRHGASIPTEAGGGGAGGGSLSSVDVAITGYTSDGPLVADGTITMIEGAHSGNKVKASPADGSSGTPAYRALVAADIPSLVATYQPLDADLTAIAALATTSVGRGLLTLASPSDATKFLNGAATPAFAQVKDSDLSTTDVTTNDVSSTKHGFAPKGDGSTNKYLNANGVYSTPSGIGGTGTHLFTLRGKQNDQPASNYGSFDVRGDVAASVYDFDDSTIEAIDFDEVIPSWYTGGGLTFDVYWMAISATSGDVVWGISLERRNANNHDIDTAAFATEQTATGTANGTSGKETKTTITVSSGSNMDSAAANDPIRIKLRRVASNGSDTMTGYAQFRIAQCKET